jgi:hypothetical protein
LDYFPVGKPIVADKRSQVGIEVGKRLSSCGFPLKGIAIVHHLHKSNPKMLGRLALYFLRNPSKSFGKQIRKVPTATVRSQYVQVVDVEFPVIMGFPYLLRIDAL